MFRDKLVITVAIATFAVGAELHLQVMRLAEQLIRYDTIVFIEPKQQARIAGDAIGLPFFDWCRVTVSTGPDGGPYVRKELIGRPEETRNLEEEIARTFARCDQELLEQQSLDLDEPILTTRWRPRMLYLRLFRADRGDMSRLVTLSRKAGANHIEVLVDRVIPVAVWRDSVLR